MNINYNIFFLSNRHKILYKDLYIEKKNFHDDAGLDIYIMEEIKVPANAISFKIKLGIKINAYIDGELSSYNIYPRSSMGSKTPLRLSNSIGLIDKGYTGELMIIIDNLSNKEFIIEKKSRLVQLVGPKHENIKVNIVDNIIKTERGEKGLGSTGN